MAVLRGFRLNTVVRVALLTITILVWLNLLVEQQSFLVATTLGLLVLILYQVYALVQHVEKTNRDLARFFNSIRHSDFSQSFSSAQVDPAFKELHQSFSEVMAQFLQTRADKEEYLKYLDTVVQHIGIGLISFGPTGEVELINTAAKRLLKSPQLRNIHSLEQSSKELADSILNLKAGENALLKHERDGTTLQLAIHATQFKMKDKLYSLISLQNIQGELERERMAKELEIAQELQRRLLPKNGFQVEGFDLAGICLPAKEVGGDYYDFFHLKDNKFGVVIGDVSGKGVPAAIYMTLLKGTLQAITDQTTSPREVLTKVNNFIYTTIERGSFITATFAVVDCAKKTCRFARAGHNPAMYYDDSSSSLSTLNSSGLALGMQDMVQFSNNIDEKEIAFHPNDLLVFYTDGITEAMNDKREEFGVERLQSIIREAHSKRSSGIIDSIIQQVQAFAGNNVNRDDMTMVVLKAK